MAANRRLPAVMELKKQDEQTISKTKQNTSVVSDPISQSILYLIIINLFYKFLLFCNVYI